MPKEIMNTYRMSIDEVAHSLSTHLNVGLSHEELKTRRKQYGSNKLPIAPAESWIRVFIRQFQSPLIYILLAAAAIIFFTGPDKLDAFIISGVLFFNAIIGAAQEGRTRSILKSLQRFLISTSVVIRDGAKELVRDEDLVVGDIILLQEGQRIPADGRIIESNNLQLDESPLTGESKAVRKNIEVLTHDASIGDRVNMIFRGTYVLSGSGKAIIVAVGLNTEIGKVHEEVEEIKTDMPLKREIKRLSYWIILFIFGLCVAMLFIGIAYGKSWNDLLVMLTALFICVVPEGIPVVLTLVLVRGAYQMAQKNVLVKRMQAVEALGRTDVIVIDKTGTLTRNEMMVLDVIADGVHWKVSGQGYSQEGAITSDSAKLTSLDHDALLYRIGRTSLLLNSAEIIAVPKLGLFNVKGDPTEAALLVFAKKLGLSPEECQAQYRKIYEIPFSSETRYHAGFFEHDDGEAIIMVIGAPEEIIARCKGQLDFYQTALEELLAEGLRVVAFAEKKVPLNILAQLDMQEAQTAYQTLIGNDFTMLGLCGMQDAIRSDVKHIIEQARRVGIHVVMATGDHKRTATYVAQRVGLLNNADRVIEGAEFQALSNDALLSQLGEITVYARVSPHDKLRIIDLFHQQKKIVAMTGDGINDAPSLVAADLGIAMGRIGTEVAKEASDVILLDDSFASIMQAVEQGRYIFDSLKRVILYFFATNMGEILIILCALLADLPLPIAAAQILWLNLVTDGFLDIALSMEPKEEGLLTQTWLSKTHHLVDAALVLKTFYSAIPMAIGSLYVFIRAYPTDIMHARTMTLITMAMFQWFNAWNCRSQTKSIFQLGFFANPWLLVAIGFVFLLQIMVTTVPVMQHIFKTVPLLPLEWVFILCISSSVVVLEELRKWIVRALMRRGYWAR